MNFIEIISAVQIDRLNGWTRTLDQRWGTCLLSPAA